MGLMEQFSRNGWIDPEALSAELDITLRDLAIAIGLPGDVFFEEEAMEASQAQERLQDVVRILTRVQDWTDNIVESWSWYRGQPIPALGGKTSAQLVSSGRVHEVFVYLDQVAAGGYA